MKNILSNRSAMVLALLLASLLSRACGNEIKPEKVYRICLCRKTQ